MSMLAAEQAGLAHAAPQSPPSAPATQDSPLSLLLVRQQIQLPTKDAIVPNPTKELTPTLMKKESTIPPMTITSLPLSRLLLPPKTMRIETYPQKPSSMPERPHQGMKHF